MEKETKEWLDECLEEVEEVKKELNINSTTEALLLLIYNEITNRDRPSVH